MQQLSLSARPKTLDAMVGAGKVVKAIRGHMKNGPDAVKAWMFIGATGSGKTTISRILALSYQCTHQEVWGTPCKECWRNESSFPIYEINGAKLTGKQEIQDALEGAEYGLLGNAATRVYIIDEVHRVSPNAQDLMLKMLEDTPPSTVFILGSTSPHKIIRTLQSRCQIYELRELEYNDIEKLVLRLLKRTKSTLPGDKLVDALIERKVMLPRFIAQAVDKYVAGLEPSDAAQIEGSTLIDTKALCRSLIKGDWPAVSGLMISVSDSDIRMVRASVVGYLETMLLESTDISDRTEAIATAILTMSQLQYADDSLISAMTSASFYRLCTIFQAYKF